VDAPFIFDIRKGLKGVIKGFYKSRERDAPQLTEGKCNRAFWGGGRDFALMRHVKF
jgi:hypothetical protein